MTTNYDRNSIGGDVVMLMQCYHHEFIHKCGSVCALATVYSIPSGASAGLAYT